eukprot:363877-Chlamydomonas_euryale.AAC.4
MESQEKEEKKTGPPPITTPPPLSARLRGPPPIITPPPDRPSSGHNPATAQRDAARPTVATQHWAEHCLLREGTWQLHARETLEGGIL